MKSSLYLLFALIILVGCNANRSTTAQSTAGDSTNILDAVHKEQDTVRITNDDIEYEIIIIEPGFNFWLASTARPEGYYSQEYMESRNRQYVTEWNIRVLQPQRFSPQLYEMRIDYDYGVDYGYEVNYKLYNYFIYFQLTYNQRLAGYVPRI
ncbi:MAG: DUF6146 family protein [Aquaticitalea sp.]